jgi:hypothetical protein
MGILAELRNRGVEDCCIVACDGLKGLPEAIGEIWPKATVQLCVVHLVRVSLRYASKKYWGQISKNLREVYTAPTEDAATARFAEFEQAWDRRTRRSSGYGAAPGSSSRRSWPVPLRAGRPQSALPRRPQPAGLPQPEHRNPELRVETSTPGVHDLLRRTNSNPMTATITYTDGRTLPICAAVGSMGVMALVTPMWALCYAGAWRAEAAPRPVPQVCPASAAAAAYWVMWCQAAGVSA